MTYADHQEAASGALVLLLGHAAPDQADLASVLMSREQLILTLVERLHHLGPGKPARDRHRHVPVHAVVENPRAQLSRMIEDLPRPRLCDARPSDVLVPGAGFAGGVTVEAGWRRAAREMFLATSELTRAEHQPWTLRPEAGWHVVADVATAIEAVMALDEGLARAGAFPRISATQAASRRLLAGDVGRLSRAYGTDDSAELATAGWGSVSSEGGGLPIQLVRVPQDFVLAQRRLAGFVRSIPAGFEPGSRSDRAGLKTGRVLAAGQVRLSDAFARWADQLPDGKALADSFRARIPLYRDLHAASARLVDLEPRRSDLPLLQQSEMVTQLRAFGVRGALSLEALTALNKSSHNVAVNLGKSLRQEAYQRRTIQRMESRGLGLRAPAPITSSSEPFYRACRALADVPHEPAAIWSPVSDQRARLRMALDDALAKRRHPQHRESALRRSPPPPGPRASL